MTTESTGCWAKLIKQCSSLSGSPRELWLVYLLKLMESYAYFSFSVIFTIYLTDEFGYSDVEAGIAYGLWGALTSLIGLAMGFVIDSLGVRRSLCLSFAVSTVARLAIALTDSKGVLEVCIYFLLPVAQSMGIPVLLTGVRRYTTSRNRGFAMGVFYAMMNVAALLSGWIVDGLNIGLADGAVLFGHRFTGNRLVLLTGTVVSAMGLAVSWRCVREIKVSDDQPELGTEATNLYIYIYERKSEP